MIDNKIKRLYEALYLIILIIPNCQWSFIVCRHRVTNMFLDAYKRNWLETEGYSFEDKMIDDLSVSYTFINVSSLAYCLFFIQRVCHVLSYLLTIRKPWKKRRKRKRRLRRSLTPFISWFFISAAQLLQKSCESVFLPLPQFSDLFLSDTYWFLLCGISLQ